MSSTTGAAVFRTALGRPDECSADRGVGQQAGTVVLVTGEHTSQWPFLGMLPYLRRRAREIRSSLHMYTAAYEPKERGAAREHQAVVPRKTMFARNERWC